jgi:hypothetical protein
MEVFPYVPFDLDLWYSLLMLQLQCENHYTASYFMDSPQGQQYDHVWWLESDVRQTGSWVSFFNHINSTIPSEKPDAFPWQKSRSAEVLAWDDTESSPWQPDYFTTVFINGADSAGNWDVRGREAKLVFGDNIAKAFIHMWGMSRRYHNILTTYLQDGQVADAGECPRSGNSGDC